MRLVPNLLSLLAILILAPASLAQQYPARPIKFLVGLPPGGSTDLIARLMARHIEKSVGQPVIVENRPGNSGSLAANAVAKSDPDGYTLFFGSATIIGPFFLKNGPITGGVDLAPVSSVTASPFFLMVRADFPAESLDEFIAYAKANPGKLNFGAASIANAFAAEVFKNRTGSTATSVSYKGAGPVATALAAKEVDFTLDALPAYRALLDEGKIRALVYAHSKPSSFAPGVPTAASVGLSNFDIAFRIALWAPVGTPATIVDRLSGLIVAAIKDPEVAGQLNKAGTEGLGSTPTQLLLDSQAEFKFWSDAAKLANFEPQ